MSKKRFKNKRFSRRGSKARKTISMPRGGIRLS